jgi:uncharacterized protein YbcV (DUF1398 family)
MKDELIATARACLEASERGTLTFPAIVGRLIAAGFESYAIDFRRARATYTTADGDSVDLPMHGVDTAVAAALDATALQAAIREAQQRVAGYTYLGFCRKAAAAGCVGYLVSFSGRRVLYVGRTAETHVEPFPQ